VGNSEDAPSWLPNGSAPASTGEAADAGSQAAHASVESAAGETATESPAYTAASPFGGQDLYGRGDLYTSSLGQEGSAMPSSSGFGESGYTPPPVPGQAEAPVSSQYSYGQSAGAPGYPAGQPGEPAGYPAGSGSGGTVGYPAGGGSVGYPAGGGSVGYPAGGPAGTAGYPVPPPRAAATVAPSQRRRANLVVARLEPWSVMKFSFLMSLVAWVVLFVAVALLYLMLSSLGVFQAIQTTLSGVTSSQGSAGFDLGSYLSASKVLGYTMLFGAVNVILITVLSTIGAMIYNVVTHLGGGIEVTLRETD
jgi:hypothetical protein